MTYQNVGYVACPDCGHDIDIHDMADGCDHDENIAPGAWIPCLCALSPSNIAGGLLGQLRARLEAAIVEHPDPCDAHPEGDVIKCGWKRAYRDMVQAVRGEQA